MILLICNCNEIYKSTDCESNQRESLSTVEQVQEKQQRVPFVGR